MGQGQGRRGGTARVVLLGQAVGEVMQGTGMEGMGRMMER